MMGGWTAATKLTSAMTYPWSNLVVDSTGGFSLGDLVVVTDGSTAHMFQVTGITLGSPLALAASTDSPLNPPSGTMLQNWPATGYGVGSPVYRVSWVTYAMDSTSFRKPALMRREFGGSPQLIAYDIAGFQVRYLMQDGSVTRTPSALSMVDEVVPVIWTRQSVPGRPAQIDSVWAEVRPRTF